MASKVCAIRVSWHRKKRKARAVSATTGPNRAAAVRELYQLNHTPPRRWISSFRRKSEYLFTIQAAELGIWETMELLDSLVDSSDPDTDLSQMDHNLQTAEAIRRDGHPTMVCAHRIHSRRRENSFACLASRSGRWSAILFPSGAPFFGQESCYPEFFEANPDNQDSVVANRGMGFTRQSAASRTCIFFMGPRRVSLRGSSKIICPKKASYMIRYHSCYVIHQQREYEALDE